MKFSVIKQRGIWWAISSLFILSGIVAMIISTTRPDIHAPLRLGLDFVGGTKLQFELDCTKNDNCSKPIELDEIRKVVTEQGLGDSSIQILSNKVLDKPQYGVSIRTKNLEVDQRTKLQDAIYKVREFDPKKTQIDSVGPTLGKQLFQSGLLAVVLSFLGILIYLTFRFKFDYAFFAFVALFHDVFITMGFFSILGLIQGVEIDSLFVVGILTIIGFSVNDTVVIYDRVREVLSDHPNSSIDQVVDDAVNQTLTRSLNTTLTVLLTLFSIFFFGGETLKNFALCLIIGFTAGAYSSIFIASTLLAWWREKAEKNKPLTVTDSISSDET
jgi:preprotein translocase subunit SecF